MAPSPVTRTARPRLSRPVALVFAIWALLLVGCTPRPDAEATFLADLNQRRAAAGLGPLEVRLNLETVARSHAVTMVTKGLHHAVT